MGKAGQAIPSVFLFTGALFGASGVLLGAFGAHALAERLEAGALSAWDTAVQYQLVHALALVLIAVLCGRDDGLAIRVAGWSHALGILMFSGSLYLLALGGPRLLGPVTPIGGVAFVLGWVALAVAARRRA